MHNAFKYAEDTAIESESDYRYTGSVGRCQTARTNRRGTSLRSHRMVSRNSERALMNAVNIGPVSVALQSSSSIFRNYRSGVIDSSSCGTRLDHAVLLIGYGTENRVPYWLF